MIKSQACVKVGIACRKMAAMSSYAQGAWQLLFHHMLADPECALRLGPDCDAALNYCDGKEASSNVQFDYAISEGSVRQIR